MVTTGPKISSRFVRHETGKTSDHGGLEEITTTAAFINRFRRFTAERDLATFFLSQIDVELDLFKLCLACDRALVGFLVERIAHFSIATPSR